MPGIVVDQISKKFSRRTVLSGVTFRVQPGAVFGITGRNGSGKSTLMKIIAGLISPTGGSVEFQNAAGVVAPEQVYREIGYAAPYIAMYDEFNALENLRLFARIRSLPFDREKASALLESIGLPTDRHDPVKTYSSGMMQRMRLAFATMHNPGFLFLDEPTSNLDEDGARVVHEIVARYKQDSCVIVASNDSSDLAMCDEVYSLDGTKPR